MNSNTIQRYLTWKKTATKHSLFNHGTRSYTQAEFDALIGIKTPVVEQKPINITEDKGYADLAPTPDAGDSEESGK